MSSLSSLSSKRICFVGAGAMAEAVIRGLIETGRTARDQVAAVNHQNRARLGELKQKYGIRVAESPAERTEAIRDADIVVLAMKPKDAGAALAEIGPLISKEQLVVSVIAGLSIRAIAAALPAGAPIARTMPNTSSSIGCGATGISFSPHVTEQQREEALDMFRSIGVVARVEEPMLDLITGLSGSGPAYVYAMMEAMIAAAVDGGMARETAKNLVAQTVLGAARMVLETGEEPGDLRVKVTSPGGTTEAALNLLAERGFADIVQSAVRRATERSIELGQQTMRQTD